MSVPCVVIDLALSTVNMMVGTAFKEHQGSTHVFRCKRLHVSPMYTVASGDVERSSTHTHHLHTA